MLSSPPQPRFSASKAFPLVLCLLCLLASVSPLYVQLTMAVYPDVPQSLGPNGRLFYDGGIAVSNMLTCAGAFTPPPFSMKITLFIQSLLFFNVQSNVYFAAFGCLVFLLTLVCLFSIIKKALALSAPYSFILAYILTHVGVLSYLLPMGRPEAINTLSCFLAVGIVLAMQDSKAKSPFHWKSILVTVFFMFLVSYNLTLHAGSVLIFPVLSLCFFLVQRPWIHRGLFFVWVGFIVLQTKQFYEARMQCSPEFFAQLQTILLPADLAADFWGTVKACLIRIAQANDNLLHHIFFKPDYQMNWLGLYGPLKAGDAKAAIINGYIYFLEILLVVLFLYLIWTMVRRKVSFRSSYALLSLFGLASLLGTIGILLNGNFYQVLRLFPFYVLFVVFALAAVKDTIPLPILKKGILTLGVISLAISGMTDARLFKHFKWLPQELSATLEQDRRISAWMEELGIAMDESTTSLVVDYPIYPLVWKTYRPFQYLYTFGYWRDQLDPVQVMLENHSQGMVLDCRRVPEPFKPFITETLNVSQDIRRRYSNAGSFFDEQFLEEVCYVPLNDDILTNILKEKGQL